MTDFPFCLRLFGMEKTLEAVLEFRLGQIMKEKLLSVRDVSERTGITVNGLYMLLERMPRAIRFDTISRLCIGLDVMPGDLFILRRPRPKP